MFKDWASRFFGRFFVEFWAKILAESGLRSFRTGLCGACTGLRNLRTGLRIFVLGEHRGAKTAKPGPKNASKEGLASQNQKIATDRSKMAVL